MGVVGLPAVALLLRALSEFRIKQGFSRFVVVFKGAKALRLKGFMGLKI